MQLNNAGLQNAKEWVDTGYAVPAYNRAEMIKRTKDAPFWVHFGAGNIFRAFPANVVQNLLNEGVLSKGIVVAEGYDYDILTQTYAAHDNYCVLATLKADGSIEKTVIGSIAEALLADVLDSADFTRLKEIFSGDSLQMVSFTITEKGYSLVDGHGKTIPAVDADFTNGPQKVSSYMGKVSALLYQRFLNGEKPVAMVSMDNCSHNGDKLYRAIETFAREWEKNGVAKLGFCSYVQNPKKVSFPWTMIDKITPRPDPSVEERLKKDGVEGLSSVVTSKNTYTAPFVNAEECQYLVIEDAFPNGRPALEKGGFFLSDRETVNACERMKVCTCLNPLHTALAVFGCLLGYRKICDEMKNPLLKKLVECIGYREGLPVVTNPGILNPQEFIDAVLNVRLPNPFMPDTPQRIAADTSQKLAIRFGETIKAYVASNSLDVDSLVGIPLVFAGWLRYLMAVDDSGDAFELSPDPLLNTVRPFFNGLSLGKKYPIQELTETFMPLLSDRAIFGVDLHANHLDQKVLLLFQQMLEETGAVTAVLKKYLA